MTFFQCLHCRFVVLVKGVCDRQYAAIGKRAERHDGDALVLGDPVLAVAVVDLGTLHDHIQHRVGTGEAPWPPWNQPGFGQVLCPEDVVRHTGKFFPQQLHAHLLAHRNGGCQCLGGGLQRLLLIAEGGLRGAHLRIAGKGVRFQVTVDDSPVVQGFAMDRLGQRSDIGGLGGCQYLAVGHGECTSRRLDLQLGHGDLQLSPRHAAVGHVGRYVLDQILRCGTCQQQARCQVGRCLGRSTFLDQMAAQALDRHVGRLVPERPLAEIKATHAVAGRCSQGLRVQP